MRPRSGRFFRMPARMPEARKPLGSLILSCHPERSEGPGWAGRHEAADSSRPTHQVPRYARDDSCASTLAAASFTRSGAVHRNNSHRHVTPSVARGLGGLGGTKLQIRAAQPTRSLATLGMTAARALSQLPPSPAPALSIETILIVMSPRA